MVGIGAEIYKSFMVFVVTLFIVAFLLGCFVMWGVPITWEYIKPLIHSMTA